jgi:hypothetical protein
MRDWISSDYPMMIIQVKGTTGGATNKLEYLCEAEPGSSTSAACWRVRKFVYDSAGFNTQILFADGDRSFDNVQANYASLSYS